ncbi:MAG TPA: hypothetical protein VK491_12750, partial [Gemmatimonadaceae bacterium]|nr:hypothetical protein [Gemmatimonadaceae bacterium]
YPIAIAAILGCASGGTSPISDTVQVPRRADYITGEEIVASNASEMTAYDAVARLRPNWLAMHGKATHGSEYATVYVDGQRYGSVESLRNIQAYQVADIRYYDITQAGARFGVQGGTAGVIEVRIRTR